jgi:hypothetical protein
LLKEQFEAMEQQRHHQNQKRSKGGQHLQQQPQLHRQTDAQEPSVEGTIKDRATGMAVIRTIVKQSQKLANERPAIQVERWTSDGDCNGRSHGDTTCDHHHDNNDDVHDKNEEFWKSLARQYMEESALRYGYGLASVQLGNDALGHAKEEGVDAPEEKEVDASSSSVSSQTTPSFFNVERCKQWIDESPIQLATILNLVANSRSENTDDA